MPGVALERHLPGYPPSEPDATGLHDDDDKEALIAEAVANNTLLAGSAGVPGVHDLHSPEQIGGFYGAQECAGAHECEDGPKIVDDASDPAPSAMASSGNDDSISDQFADTSPILGSITTATGLRRSSRHRAPTVTARVSLQNKRNDFFDRWQQTINGVSNLNVDRVFSPGE